MEELNPLPGGPTFVPTVARKDDSDGELGIGEMR
jgi:hypothetical protein